VTQIDGVARTVPGPSRWPTRNGRTPPGSAVIRWGRLARWRSSRLWHRGYCSRGDQSIAQGDAASIRSCRAVVAGCSGRVRSASA